MLLLAPRAKLLINVLGVPLASKFTKIQKIADLFKNLLATTRFEGVPNTVVACALKKGKIFLEVSHLHTF